MLNSAPVQLLPVEQGRGQKNSDSVKSPDRDPDGFNKALESVMKEGSGKAAEPEKEIKKKTVSTENVKNKAENGTEFAEKAEDGKAAAETDRKTKGRKSDGTGKDAATSTADGKDGVLAELLQQLSGGHKKEADVKMKIGFTGKAAEDDADEKASSVEKLAGKTGIHKPSVVFTAHESPLLAGLKASAGNAGKRGGDIPIRGKKAGSVEKDGRVIKNAGKAARIAAAVDPAAVLKKRFLAAPLSTDDETKEKGGDKAKLRVSDHRRPVSMHGSKMQHQPDTAPLQQVSEQSSQDSSSVKTIELNGLYTGTGSSTRSREPAAQRTALMSSLKETVNSEIVKQAGIMVKGNGSGEIRLVIKPENLGKVRIKLSLNDNHIAGRIIVENNIVREIFESNLTNLYKAFGSEGFEASGLEVTVQGGGDGKTGKQSHGEAGRRAVRAIEDMVPEVADTEWQYNAVNMVV